MFTCVSYHAVELCRGVKCHFHRYFFLQEIFEQQEKRISQRGDINYKTDTEKTKLIAYRSIYSETL